MIDVINIDLCVACSKTSQSLGKIRLTVRLTEERILPSEYYEPLIEILNDSVSLEKVREQRPYNITCTCRAN